MRLSHDNVHEVVEIAKHLDPPRRKRLLNELAEDGLWADYRDDDEEGLFYKDSRSDMKCWLNEDGWSAGFNDGEITEWHEGEPVIIPRLAELERRVADLQQRSS